MNKELIKQYQQQYSQKLIEWNNTLLFEWEYKMLLEARAIDNNKILNDAFSLKIDYGNGDVKYEHFDGDVKLIQEKCYEINLSKLKKTKASIMSWPKTYSRYKEIQKENFELEMRQEFAEKVNTPPLQSLKE